MPVVAAIVITFVATALIAVVLVRRLWRDPVQALRKTADRLAIGDWDARTQRVGADDVQLLAERLDRVGEQARAKIASLELQSSNLQLLVDALPDPILVSDADDRIALVNAPAARLLQVPAAQLLGKKFVAAVSEASILEMFEQVAASPKLTPAAPGVPGHRDPIHREIRLNRDGQRLSFQALAERTVAGGVLVVLRDVSTLAATIQMKTDFVANASHELRTPISAIKVAFETLRDVYRENEQLTDRCIGIIDGHLKRLEDMLRDLLDLSRVESAALKPHFAKVRAADLAAIIRSTWANAAKEKNVELRFSDSVEGLTFVSDRRLLDLVLKNLVENALKFTPAGGSITVQVDRKGDDASKAEVHVSVVDTGIGIPPEHLERVFERFYQVDPARTGFGGRGTGLGLSIVKHAINALGGSVKIASVMNQGTTITCVLPQSDVEESGDE
ncbi:MAG: ATP-binding protein [Tepidisphaeraceae bacterium]